MVIAGDFKNGITFEMDGSVYQVIEFQHVKPGKGAAFVRTKLKNVITGGVVEKTFSPTDKFDSAYIERKDMQYSYNDGDLYYFMDQETYDMVPLNRDMLGDAFRFVKENTMCMILSIKGNVFGVEPPNFVDLEVTETEPGLAGNTATNTLKPACNARDRRGDQGAPVHQHRRQDPDRHPHGRVYRPFQVSKTITG